MIPKPDGSQRELGIPTVTDRLIQQTDLQVMQPITPPPSANSHRFRPGRRAHDAVKAARACVQSGKRVLVGRHLGGGATDCLGLKLSNRPVRTRMPVVWQRRLR